MSVMITVIIALTLRGIYAGVTIDAALYDLEKTDITDFTIEGEVKNLY